MLFRSDLDLDFQFNSATKDIQKLTDVESVKRSVRNLINRSEERRVGKECRSRWAT